MPYDHEKRLFMANKYVNKNVTLVQRQYRKTFNSKTIPSCSVLLGIWYNFRKKRLNYTQVS